MNTDVKHARAEQIQNLLKDEGYIASIEADGDIRFKSEGFIYWIQVYEDDPQYFHMILPGIWKIPSASESDRLNTLSLCNEVNLTAKMAKLTIQPDSGYVDAAAQMLIFDDKEFSDLLFRCFTALQHASARIDDVAEKHLANSTKK